MKVEWREIKFEIDDFTKSFLKSRYPFFERELVKMEMWYIANPKKRKKNHMRFMVSWLNRVLDKEKPGKDYKKDDNEFLKKMEKAKEEAAPPPSDWKAMMAKLKRGT